MARIEPIVHQLPSGAIVHVEFVYDSLIAKLIIPHMSAITLWNRVYVREARRLPQHIIRHELRHVEQWYALGPVKFLARYLWESLRHGYYNNPFEVDARSAERLDS